MASNTSAVLDVVTENRDLSKILKEIDRSTVNSPPENSLTQSGSLDSISTLHDVENLSELNVDENSDLCVKIDNPQKHLETLETFVSFRITTKVARIEFSESEYVVRRRYNDFIWLRQKLSESHPFCIIPPLPGKHSLIGQLDRYSKEFILSRMKSLNIFITRLAQHPILSCNDHFKVFLTAKQLEFTQHRRQKPNGDSKTRQIHPNPITHVSFKNHNLEFDQTKAYLSVLAEKLSSIEKITSRINRQRTELAAEMANLHPIFAQWSKNEPDLAPILRGIAEAVEGTAMAQALLTQSHTPSLSGPVKDFLAYIDVVQDVLKKRDIYQAAYENSLEELNRRHNEKDRLIAAVASNNSSAPSSFPSFFRQPTCDEKLEKLGVFIPQLLKKVETHQDNLECANESLRSDLERWQIEKSDCLRKILNEFIDDHVECCRSSLEVWKGVADQVQKRGFITNNTAEL